MNSSTQPLSGDSPVHVCGLRSFHDNQLRPNAASALTWTEFRDQLHARKHERRGPAGSKKTEEPYKNGKARRVEHSAFMPVLVDFESPQCGCVHTKTSRPFRDYADSPATRHRAKHSVRGCGGLVVLDVDDLPPELWEALWQALRARGVDAVAVSSHGHGREPRVVKARLFLKASRGYSAEEISAVRAGVARQLTDALRVDHAAAIDALMAGRKAKSARHDGTIADAACFGPHSLFFWPSCPDDAERAAAAFNRSTFAEYGCTGSVDVDAAITAAGDRLEREERKAERAELREELGLEGEATGGAGAAHKAAAEAELSGLMTKIIQHPTQSNMGGLLNYGTINTLGRYARAGALELDDAKRKLTLAVHLHGQRLGVDPEKIVSRFVEAHNGLTRGFNAGPALPEVDEDADEIDAATGGLAVLEQQLAEQKPTHACTLEEAARRVRGAIVAGTSYRMPGHPLVIAVDTGAGKTHVAAQVAAERAERGEETVIVTQEHSVLSATRDRIRDRVVTAHVHGPLHQIDDDPVCTHPEIDRVRKAVGLGYSLRGSICPSCPKQETCAARSWKTPQALVLFAPTAAFSEAQESHRGAALIVDEQPDTLERVKISKPVLERLAHSGSHVHLQVQYKQSAVVAELASAVVEGRACRAVRVGDERIEDPMQQAATWHGQLMAQWSSVPVVEDPTLLADLNAMRGLLKIAAHCAEQGRRIPAADASSGISVLVPGAVYRELRDHGGVLLSATPLLPAFPAATVVRVAVRDPEGVRIERRIHYRAHSGSAKVLRSGPDGGINWPRVERDLSHVLENHGGAILLCTFKPLADALRTTHKHLLSGRTVEIAHYGAVRGKNLWQEGAERECTAFVSLYDPRGDVLDVVRAFAPAGLAEDEASRWAHQQWRKVAADEIAQFHGRARDVRRTKPCTHSHYGKIAPSSWHVDNTTIERVDRGARDPESHELLLRVCDTWRALTAKLLGVSKPTLTQWKTGKRPIPSERLALLRKLYVPERMDDPFVWEVESPWRADVA